MINKLNVYATAEGSFNAAGVKLDPTVRPEDLRPRPPSKPMSPIKPASADAKAQSGTRNTGSALVKLRTPVSIKTLEIQPLVCAL